MVVLPKKILDDFRKKKIDRQSATKLLISLIENSNDDKERIDSLKIIEEIRHFDEDIFHFLENLFVSDFNSDVRYLTALIIRSNFLNKALPLMKWAISHEQNIECLAVIIDTLRRLDTSKSKKILFEEVKKITRTKYIYTGNMTSNNLFRKQVKKMLKTHKSEDFTSSELVSILMNYKTIIALKEKYYSVYYEVQNAKVIKLDLSDIEFEVRGWKSEFKNDITDPSEIPGLENLDSLKFLYLSNNRISNIKWLSKLNSVTDLCLSNNEIDDIKNLEYLKKFPNLEIVDLSGNGIVEWLNIQDLDITFKLKLKQNKSYYN